MLTSLFRKLGQYSVRDFLGYLIAVFGAVVCLTSARYVESSAFWHDVIRDVGIAFLVAIIVSGIYELFARSRYDEEIRQGHLDVVMGKIVHQDVWREVRRQVLEKDMIRERMKIKIKLTSGVQLFEPNSTQALLWMELSYELKGLRSRKKRVVLTHSLDNHIRMDEKYLPRFGMIVIGKKFYDCDAASQEPNNQLKQIKIKDAVLDLARGEFSKRVELQPREVKDGLAVETRRYEITHIPGSYNLTMSEMTQGVSITLEELPPGIVGEVNIWPHTSKAIPLQAAVPFERNDLLLLPGQSIELRFKQGIQSIRRDQAATHPDLTMPVLAVGDDRMRTVH